MFLLEVRDRRQHSANWFSPKKHHIHLTTLECLLLSAPGRLKLLDLAALILGGCRNKKAQSFQSSDFDAEILSYARRVHTRKSWFYSASGIMRAARSSNLRRP